MDLSVDDESLFLCLLDSIKVVKCSNGSVESVYDRRKAGGAVFTSIAAGASSGDVVVGDCDGWIRCLRLNLDE